MKLCKSDFQNLNFRIFTLFYIRVLDNKDKFHMNCSGNNMIKKETILSIVSLILKRIIVKLYDIMFRR